MKRVRVKVESVKGHVYCVLPDESHALKHDGGSNELTTLAGQGTSECNKFY